jgi:hypothetical protein
VAATTICPSGHPMPTGTNRICLACRRQQVITAVTAADASLPHLQVIAAVEAVATNAAAWRSLATALSQDAQALAYGAPPVVGRLVIELIERGSTRWTTPACTTCQRTGRPLKRTSQGAVCQRCAHRAHTAACTRCGQVKPIAGRDGAPRESWRLRFLRTKD